MNKRSASFWGLGGALALLALFSIYLALNRIYQVDEAQNVFMARIIGTGQTGTYYTNAPVWLMGPLAWLARSVPVSTDLFMWNRLIFLGLFWANVALIALNTGIKLRSLQGLAVLLGAATLAPLWDYGFEIRHDNLILTGLLLTWWIGRTGPAGKSSYFFIGFLAVLLQFVAFKAFVYVLPISAAFLAFPSPAHRQGRVRLAAMWIAGAAVALILCRLAYLRTGLWTVYLAGLQGGLDASGGGTRFGAGMSLSRTLVQTPLLLAIAAAALWNVGRNLRFRGLASLGWEGAGPEALLFLAMLIAFFVNPTPFPYNLVNLVPFAFLLGFRFLGPELEGLSVRPAVLAMASGVLCFTHVVPFMAATWRHLDWNNERQEQLMRTAEAFTDSSRDAVYDAIGMVPTRPSIHFQWFLHSLNIQSFLKEKSPGIQELLGSNPPVVLIPSYRTDWLRQEDWTFIQSRYVPLADDFWVLGQALATGGGECMILHSGRYQVVGQRNGNIAPLDSGMCDGKAIGNRPVELGIGRHEVSCPKDVRPAFIWVGPKLERLPELGRGDHQRLFVNWY
ncbi:MAG: hypothetical protein IPQ13_12920 [Holophagaceae bacterium]|nr:hypothetical protein [Holophagaceae bacterium]